MGTGALVPIQYISLFPTNPSMYTTVVSMFFSIIPILPHYSLILNLHPKPYIVFRYSLVIPSKLGVLG